MKFSEAWLREWVDPPLKTGDLAHALTMAGLEVDSVEPVAGTFSQVVIGEVIAREQHPDADKLSLCRVDVGAAEMLQIVCGAPNVREGLKAPVALIGGVLPGGLKIRKAKLRGVESNGMLCSEKELGLGDGAGGLMELPGDASVGEDLRQWLALDDSAIDIDLTPNRGDCFSVLGIARETGVLARLPLQWPDLAAVVPSSADTFPVEVRATDACPRFCGRVVRGIDPAAQTPRWMRERLRRSGLRPIHPVVDVTNYVMLELGQPLHGFDLDTLREGLVVRMGEQGEQLTLLDGRVIELTPAMLVIADHGGARALAGIMGGESSGVEAETRNVFFEGAFFTPEVIAGRARQLGLHTDASMRFERGVDPEGQRRAVERATALLIAIAGGEAGPLIELADEAHLPVRMPVALRRKRLRTVLGAQIADRDVCSILELLGMPAESTADGWSVTPPSWRFDIAIEEDLIEEVARVHGYDNIAEAPGRSDMRFSAVTETRVPADRARDLLVARGYQEVVTYSFVDKSLQQKIWPGRLPIVLSNPISSAMTDMRVSLWPGLLGVLKQNQSRQRERARIFEYGLKFYLEDDEIKQINTISGIMSGARFPEQWGLRNEPADFFDIKGDVQALLCLSGALDGFTVEPASHTALHPGQSARLLRGQRELGWMGALHPAIRSELDIKNPVYLFELDSEILLESVVPATESISRFPAVRRDLAVLVDQALPVARLLEVIRDAAGPLLQDLIIFDVYQGPGVDSGLKSVALGLILQETSRTLTDGDVDELVVAVVSRLERELEARIRD